MVVSQCSAFSSFLIFRVFCDASVAIQWLSSGSFRFILDHLDPCVRRARLRAGNATRMKRNMHSQNPGRNAKLKIAWRGLDLVAVP
jgi:hypothetical protein